MEKHNYREQSYIVIFLSALQVKKDYHPKC